MKDNLLANGATLIGFFDIYKTVMKDFKRLGISSNLDRFKDAQISDQEITLDALQKLRQMKPEKIRLPSLVYIPTQITEQQLKGTAQIRQLGRLPTVTYLHN